MKPRVKTFLLLSLLTVSLMSIVGLTLIFLPDSEESAKPTKETPVSEPLTDPVPFPKDSVNAVRDYTLTTMSNLQSVHIEGTQTDGTTFKVTVHEPGKCTIIHESGATGRVQLDLTPQRTLLRGDEKFWLYATNQNEKKAKYALAEAGSKWVQAPSEDWDSFQTYCNLRPLFGSFIADGYGNATLEFTDGGLVAITDAHSNITATVSETPPHYMFTYLTENLELSFSEHDGVEPHTKILAKNVLKKKLLLAKNERLAD